MNAQYGNQKIRLSSFESWNFSIFRPSQFLFPLQIENKVGLSPNSEIARSSLLTKVSVGRGKVA